MIRKIIFAIFIFAIAISIVEPVGVNFIIVSQSIPNDDNGFIINARCSNNGDGSFIIKVAPHVVGSPDQNVIVAHEIGHVNHWDDWEEADCDAFAMSIVPGSFIQDVYSGVH